MHVGGPRLLEMLNLTPPPALQAFADDAGRKGQTVVYLVQDAGTGNNAVSAAFALADVIRPESKGAVEELHAMGKQVALLTGDSRAVAEAVANELGIDQVFAEVLPGQKDEKVAALQAQGKSVAMVGDGVNDAPALTRADVGIAVGAGTDVAVESAGIILVRNNPADVAKTVRLSRDTYRKMVAEPVVGDRLQHRGPAAGCRHSGPHWHRAIAGRRRGADGRQHDRSRDQCANVAWGTIITPIAATPPTWQTLLFECCSYERSILYRVSDRRRSANSTGGAGLPGAGRAARALCGRWGKRAAAGAV